MPKPSPEEFRNEVVACAVNREPGITIEQIAHDFGIHPMTLTKWMRQAQTVKNAFTGMSAAESAVLRDRFASSRKKTRSSGALPRTSRRPCCREKVVSARERARP